MLESVSDLVSLIVMIAAVLVGFYFLYSLTNLHRSMELRRHEETYYSLYDEISDSDEDESEDRVDTE